MKPKAIIGTMLITASLTLMTACGQDATTVEATTTDISDNLDLRAVATVFGISEDLEDFERRLNDPDLKISNLDLNGDGYVDYLRVIEVSENGTHVVLIQAVIGEDLYQDVATIDVERDDSGETRVQVVGDVYMYGPDYIIEPYYSYTPVIYVWFWGPHYHPWHSPYYWGYYPGYYHPWHPYPVYVYVDHVHSHIATSTTYTYVGHRGSSIASGLHRKHGRSYYRAMDNTRPFAKRNDGLKNKHELMTEREEIRAKTGGKNTRDKDGVRPDRRRVQPDWKPSKDGRPNKVVVPKDRNERREKPSLQPKRTPTEKPTRTPQKVMPGTDPSNKNIERPAPKKIERPAPKRIERPAPQRRGKPDLRNDRPTTKPPVRPQSEPRKKGKPRS